MAPRSGLTLLADDPGTGNLVERQGVYRVRLKMWLNQGDPVRWPNAWGPVDTSRLEDGGATLLTDLHIHRGSLMNGLFYGVEGMRVGGTRRLRIAPHLAYGKQGVGDVIPADAVLTVEIEALNTVRLPKPREPE